MSGLPTHELSEADFAVDFETTVPHLAADLPPRIAHSVAELGIPRSFIGKRYRLTPKVESVELGDHGHFLHFADSTLGGLFIDPETGAIVSSRSGAPHLVNSSLRQFNESVRAVIGMFPFYRRGSSLDERQSVGQRMRVALRSIDEAAAEIDSFWGTYIDDLEIGDFPAEDVIESP